MSKWHIFAQKAEKSFGKYYENSTQKWLPIENIQNGIVLLKDGRYIKVIEVLPVNFYLKSEVEQENIIYYFASYLKIAPDNLQIRVMTQRADIEGYLDRLQILSESEQNNACKNMILDEMAFVQGLSEHIAIKKRFFIVFEYAGKGFGVRENSFADVCRALGDEAYKAQRYLSQCGLEVLGINDDGALIDLFYSLINKHAAHLVKPGGFAADMTDEIHTYEGGMVD
ncbi:MAG: hypothetical protein HFI90_02300 [Clostridia bacterium]|nr:hypothetical protein [Clostridia bacterium]